MLTLDESDLLELQSVRVKYKKGEIICKQGALASHIMYMEKGLAKVYLDDGLNSLVLKIIPDGNMLGLSSVNSDNNTYQYSAMAYIDSEIKQIDIRFFKQMLGQNPGFAREVINILGSNSVQINGRFFCLTHKQSYGRLADILLCLSERIFRKYDFELPISRKELAELSGMSPETVIRMLKKFNDEGLIRMEGKSFSLLDPIRMKRISETG
jgi:CRP/FNR family transcriptional regulator, polysaccharide utilization system transcription regulator